MSKLTTDPVRWGILGVAKIATQKVIPGMQGSPLLRIEAIASRDQARADAAARELGIPRAHGSYEALLTDPAIEAIYNPLPNHLHVPWTVKALEAGKHVLCEKPISLTAEEAKLIGEAEARTGRRAAEAFMIRFHPQWIRAREIVAAGTLGEIRAVNIMFAYNNVDPANIRNKADIGGGGLYDIGCYAIAGSRFLLGADPIKVVSLIDRDPVMGTDRLTSGLMAYPGNVQVTFTVSTQCVLRQKVHVLGTKGRLEIEVPFNTLPTRPTRILVDDGRDIFDSGVRVEEFPACDQYGLQGEAFSKAIRGEAAWDWPVADAVTNMRVIDALFRSERTQGWEKP
ncbi:Gfo/Idh/MocA family oxidoreductase [uncultured Alsobacter sp.]|uniref:Gfo/Idh/MocA family protein n=1 Tax=uncultured Alsobacter sp. TaxID=1748258 RepID=UPI0025CEBECB|nr:Gfo/Idh/MocA family oxidoreductase [uncultured Alsobacter sp.]